MQRVCRLSCWGLLVHFLEKSVEDRQLVQNEKTRRQVHGARCAVRGVQCDGAIDAVEMFSRRLN